MRDEKKIEITDGEAHEIMNALSLIKNGFARSAGKTIALTRAQLALLERLQRDASDPFKRSK